MPKILAGTDEATEHCSFSGLKDRMDYLTHSNVLLVNFIKMQILMPDQDSHSKRVSDGHSYLAF